MVRTDYNVVGLIIAAVPAFGRVCGVLHQPLEIVRLDGKHDHHPAGTVRGPPDRQPQGSSGAACLPRPLAPFAPVLPQLDHPTDLQELTGPGLSIIVLGLLVAALVGGLLTLVVYVV